MDEKRIAEALQLVDINLYDQHGRIKGLHEVADELSRVFGKLDFSEQCYISKEIREGMQSE